MKRLLFGLFGLALSASQAFAWGALMVSDDGDEYGWSIGKPSESAAIEAARKVCGVYCSPTFPFSKTCAAFARDAGTHQWGFAKGDAQAKAEDAAMKACVDQGASQCKVVNAGCD